VGVQIGLWDEGIAPLIRRAIKKLLLALGSVALQRAVTDHVSVQRTDANLGHRPAKRCEQLSHELREVQNLTPNGIVSIYGLADSGFTGWKIDG